ncbi:1-phosphofructokinase family hexose kinase [Jannaschia aquimarina]|uniref:Phosphofructokinase n=1 Tax=Jannaschia aquimarina TaxID=935700 RepID=A0A0D1CI64_9RHOB|nr:hexose kinase [Jannaschia aquimarina]KIT14357.1 6-phosphofructokinase isozyme 2 [Jannaschia aquimarina]SNS86896.1 6-phosphofructokinase [Jannaschia aquimarina]
MAEILTITANPALDLSTDAPAVIPDRKLRCTAPLIHPGGGGVNISRAIANLGGESRALVAYGGQTGQQLVDLIEAEGLTCGSLGVDYATRQSISVRDMATGLQYRFMMPGSDWTASDAEAACDAILGAVTPGALVIPSGSLPPGLSVDFFLDLVPDLAAQGARMVIDTSGPALSRAAEAKAGLYVLRMDTAEAEELTGRTLSDLHDIAALTSELRAAGAAEIVVVAAGAQGTVIDTGDWRGLTRPPVVVVHSKIGAGDSFMGAFALSLSRGEDAVTACCWGTAAAASAVTTHGTELCRREEVERFFGQVERVGM